jgi:hypothetical protein
VPESKKGKKILANMKREYGAKAGTRIFYKSINRGTISGTGTNTERAKKKRAR